MHRFTVHSQLNEFEAKAVRENQNKLNKYKLNIEYYPNPISLSAYECIKLSPVLYLSQLSLLTFAQKFTVSLQANSILLSSFDMCCIHAFFISAINDIVVWSLEYLWNLVLFYLFILTWTHHIPIGIKMTIYEQEKLFILQ